MSSSVVKVKRQISSFNNSQTETNNLLDFFKQLCSDFDEIGFQINSNSISLSDRHQQLKDLQKLRQNILLLDQSENQENQNFIENILKLLALAKQVKFKCLLLNIIRVFGIPPNLATNSAPQLLPPIVLIGALLPFMSDANADLRYLSCSCLVDLALACYSYHHQVKEIQPVIQMFEAKVVASCFNGKTPKAREMAITFLLQIVEEYPRGISIKAFVPSLVMLLHDGSESVRNASKAAIVQLHHSCKNGEAYTADVLNEMSKQSIRPSIVNFISKNFTSTSSLTVSPTPPLVTALEATSSPAFAPAAEEPVARAISVSQTRILSPTTSLKETSPNAAPAPSSKATGGSTAPEPSPIHMSSMGQLSTEVLSFARLFQDKETEQNWSERDVAIQRMRGVVRGIDGALKKPSVGMVECIKPLIEPLVQTTNSLRSALIFSSCSLLTDLADSLGPLLHPFLDTLILPALLRLAASSKKMINKTCAQVFDKVVKATHAWTLDKCVLVILEGLVHDKRVSVRSCCAEVICLFLEKWGKDVAGLSGALVERLEKAIGKSVVDQDAGVRRAGRDGLFVLSQNWSDSSARILALLDPSSLKTVLKSVNDQKAEKEKSAARSPINTRLRRRSSVRDIEQPVVEAAPNAAPSVIVESIEAKFEVPVAITPDTVFQKLSRKNHQALFDLVSLLKQQNDQVNVFESLDQGKVASNLKATLQCINLNASKSREFWDSVSVVELSKMAILMGSEFHVVPSLLVFALDPTLASSASQTLLESYLARVKSNMGPLTLLQAILDEVGVAGGVSGGAGVKTRRKSMQKVDSARDFLVKWACRIIASQQQQADDVFDEPLVRAILNRFLPLLQEGQEGQGIQADLEQILPILAGSHAYSAVFWEVVGTFDVEIGNRVRQICPAKVERDALDEFEEMRDKEDEEMMMLQDGSMVQEQQVEEFDVEGGQEDDFFSNNQLIRNESVAVDGAAAILAENAQVVNIATSANTTRKDFESPLAKRPFSSARLSRDAIGQTPPKHVRYESLFEEVVALSSMLETRQESLMTTMTRIYRLLKKPKAELRSLPIGSLFRAMSLRIRDDENNVDEIEILLVLLKEIIDTFTSDADMYETSLRGHEATLFDILFTCRSHGCPSVSGTADLTLRGLIKGSFGSSKGKLATLMSIMSLWDLTDAASPAFTLFGSSSEQVQQGSFKPYPVVSGLYCLSLIIQESNPMELEQIFDLDLLPFLQATMKCNRDVVRKASYDCIMPCLSVLKDRFWLCARSRLTDQQVAMVSLLQKKLSI